MKAFSKDQIKEKAKLVNSIRIAHAELETAIGAYNEATVAARDEVQGKMDALNEKIQEAQEWTESIVADMQSYYDEKSEKWQESENGQTYSSWKDEYESLSADGVEFDFPDDIEVPECGVADDLENLPDEP